MRKQDERIKKSAELTHSGFLKETLPLMTRLESTSEFTIKVQYSSPLSITNKVRRDRKMLRDSLKKKSWGVGKNKETSEKNEGLNKAKLLRIKISAIKIE